MSPASPAQSLLPPRGHHLPAAVAVVVAVGLLVGLAEVLADLGRLAAVLVLQLGLVLAWVLVTGLQGFAGSLAVGAGAAVAADLALVLPERPSLGGLLAVLGMAFLAVVLQQMVRRERPDLVASLAGAVLLVSVVAALAAVLLLGRGAGADGRASMALVSVGTAVLVGHGVDLVLPRPRVAAGVPRGLVGLGASVLAAATVAWSLRDVGGLTDQRAAALGAVLGGVAALAAVVASYLVVDATSAANGRPRVSRWALPVLQAVLPLAAAAPVALALQAAL